MKLEKVSMRLGFMSRKPNTVRKTYKWAKLFINKVLLRLCPCKISSSIFDIYLLWFDCLSIFHWNVSNLHTIKVGLTFSKYANVIWSAILIASSKKSPRFQTAVVIAISSNRRWQLKKHFNRCKASNLVLNA